MSTSLNPFPHGWYVLAESKDLQPNTHMARTWMGREVIVWRAEDGSVLVADAFCPHLGAHLGPEAGGLLRENRLVCPFHGFEYAHSGQCVKIAQGAAPSAIKLHTYPVQEANGLVCAYYDSTGKAPEWSVPEVPESDFTHRAFIKSRMRAHPQTTSENSVDWSHLLYLHKYENLKHRADTEIDGPFLNAYYAFDRGMTAPLLNRFRFHYEVDVSVWGLGISIVTVHAPEIGVKSRKWLLATPSDGEYIDYWMGAQVLSAPRLGGLHRLPQGFVLPRLSKLFARELATEVGFDEKIWSRMAFQPNPGLCQTDRDIFRYRRYCEQFYPNNEPCIAVG